MHNLNFIEENSIRYKESGKTVELLEEGFSRLSAIVRSYVLRNTWPSETRLVSASTKGGTHPLSHL